MVAVVRPIKLVNALLLADATQTKERITHPQNVRKRRQWLQKTRDSSRQTHGIVLEEDLTSRFKCKAATNAVRGSHIVQIQEIQEFEGTYQH